MKTILLVFAIAAGALLPLSQAQPGVTAGQVGVYDSRAVAYAHFWSKPETQARNALMREARDATAQGDKERAASLRRELVARQRASHLQVFSTAPAEQALAALAPQRPKLLAELGVRDLVSRWDPVLRSVPAADQLDVTDRLVAELLPQPSEQQQRTLSAMKSAKPLPLWRAKLMDAFHGL